MHGHVQPGHAGGAVGVHACIALRHAQGARREVAAEKGQVLAAGACIAPAQLRAVGAQAAAFVGRLVVQAARLGGGNHGAGLGGQQREIDNALAMALQLLPPALLGRGRSPGDEFEIGAVGKHHQGVVRGAARVLAAAQHVEAQRGVVGNGAFQVLDRDDDVVEWQGHGRGAFRTGFRLPGARRRWSRCGALRRGCSADCAAG